ncbi:uncharacterized protein [Apostichopus japonicus]|uniref:uncharacterized protein n=1 Tax=Stichopus japonicus TaxID=307972 RepID=UPI003AB70BA6
MEGIFLFPLFFLAFTTSSRACSPGQGFFTIVKFPEVRSKGESLYVYAINDFEITSEDRITIEKDDRSIDSGYVQTGSILGPLLHLFGCYIQINLPRGLSGQYKAGTYTANFIPSGVPGIQQSLALVKSKSQILDTRGLFSLTVYPASADPEETRLDHRTQTINLAWSPGCNKIKWYKDGRLVNTGRQMRFRKIENAGGVYNIQQRSRGKRGLFVPFSVTVASCPADMYFNEGSNSCIPRRNICVNGGVGRDKSDTCLCPPYLAEPNCFVGYVDVSVPVVPLFILSVADNRDGNLRCSDLPGGHAQCKGMLFCLGDLYGCKCAPGWRGNSCDKPCQKGKWGADCKNLCPLNCPDCNPFETTSWLGEPPLECL